MKPGKGKKKHKLLPIPNDHQENSAPRGEYNWMNIQNSPGPGNRDGIPSGLKNLSRMDAIAWVHANCKFAFGMPRIIDDDEGGSAPEKEQAS